MNFHGIIIVFALAFNPKTNKFIRQKYKKELISFEDKCKIIEYLSSNMKSGYIEPPERPIHFDDHMKYFLDLQTMN